MICFGFLVLSGFGECVQKMSIQHPGACILRACQIGNTVKI